MEEIIMINFFSYQSISIIIIMHVKSLFLSSLKANFFSWVKVVEIRQLIMVLNYFSFLFFFVRTWQTLATQVNISQTWGTIFKTLISFCMFCVILFQIMKQICVPWLWWHDADLNLCSLTKTVTYMQGNIEIFWLSWNSTFIQINHWPSIVSQNLIMITKGKIS